MSSAKGSDGAKPPQVSPDKLVWAIVAVFVFGFGSMIGLTGVMKEVLRSNDGMINAAILLSFLLMVAVEGVFIWLLADRKRGAKEAGDTALLKEQLEPGAMQKPLLPEPAGSVTEHTTRSFEPIYPERKAE